MPASDAQLFLPFASVLKSTVKTPEGERPARIVTGVMTDETLDLDGQVIDYEWASKAAQSWFSSFANIREQHDPGRAVGKGQRLDLEPDRKAIVLTAKIIDPDAILKVDEGVLSGYSVGIKSARVIKDPSAPNGRIVGGSFIETSIVDHPCNTSCKFAVEKVAGGELPADELTAKDYLPTPTLEGDEAQHNAPLQAALDAIRTLIAQEAGEGGDEWDCIAQLAAIASALRSWANDEMYESTGAELAVSVQMAAALPDRAQRATSIRNIAKALSAAKETSRLMSEEIQPAAAADADPAAADVEEKAAAAEPAPEPTPAPAPAAEVSAEEAAKAADPELRKASLQLGSLIDWALAQGLPSRVVSGLVAFAHAQATAGTVSGNGPEAPGLADPSSGGHPAAPVNPESIPPVPTQVGASVQGADFVPRSVSADEVREIVADVVEKILTSETVLTKLAAAGEAKVAAAEATDVAKATATDLTSKVAEVEGDLEELRKSLSAEIERIKALPQAPQAATGALPPGVHPVEKSYAANPAPAAGGAGEGSMAPELVELMKKAQAGDWKAALEFQRKFAEAGPKASEEVLKATYQAAA